MRKKWTDLTSRTKKAEAERRRDMFATGGGEGSHTATSDTEMKIIQVMGTEVIEGILPGMDFGLLKAEQLLSLGNGGNQVLLNGLDPDDTQKVCVSVLSADASDPGQSISVSTQTEKSEIRERKRNLGGIDDVAEIEKRRLKVEGVLTKYCSTNSFITFWLSVFSCSSIQGWTGHNFEKSENHIFNEIGFFKNGIFKTCYLNDKFINILCFWCEFARKQIYTFLVLSVLNISFYFLDKGKIELTYAEIC